MLSLRMHFPMHGDDAATNVPNTTKDHRIENNYTVIAEER